MKNGIVGFGHLSLTVSSIDRSLKLYRDLFGFDVRMERDKSVPGLGTLHVVSLGSPTGNLELIRLPDPMSRSGTEFSRNWHFSIVVEDIDSTIDALSGIGIEVDRTRIDFDPNWIGGKPVRSVHFKGFDGESLELEQF